MWTALEHGLPLILGQSAGEPVLPRVTDIPLDLDATSTSTVEDMSTREPVTRSIQEVARLTGTTSRTLRHYDDIGLLPPSEVAANGYRRYDQRALVRLQRILLLRELGLSLPTIAEVLDGQASDAAALRTHLEWLRQEKERLDRQIASVEITMNTMEGGGRIMAEQMFDGFDHTQHKQEVVDRWGEDAYAQGDVWWRSKTAEEKAAFQSEHAALAAEWTDAATRGEAPDGDIARALVQRHIRWLGQAPGAPRVADGRLDPDYVTGLGEMYVADPRFGSNYGGPAGAELVRDALRVYVEQA